MSVIRIKRGLAANVASQTLQTGEPLITTDTGKLYIQTTAGKSLINPSPENWIAPSLLNSWSNYTGIGFAPAGYYKDPYGIVRLRGFIRNGVIETNMFVLPAGYRPAYDMRFPAVGTDMFIQLQIGADGSVKNVGVISNTFVSLDGLTFLAQQ